MTMKRTVYFDYLRILATFAVIVIHVSADKWTVFGGRSFEWNAFNFYDSIARWGVPIFLMISGSLFLSREHKVKTLYSKYISRLVVSFGVWALFYAVLDPVLRHLLDNTSEISYRTIIANTILGKYHLWFIPMIIGLYMCVPIIKRFVDDTRIVKYFLLLSFIFAFAIPQIIVLIEDFIGGSISAVAFHIKEVVTDMNMSMVLGYSFYFILGYALDRIELGNKWRKTIYALGVFGFASTIILNAIVAWKTSMPCSKYMGAFRINVLLEVVAVHTFIKYRKFEHERINAFVAKFSKYSFGAYLVHVFIFETMALLGFDTLVFNPLASIPIISIIVALLSFFVSFLINYIPILNKWIV